MHGDEGQGKKNKNVLVLSWNSIGVKHRSTNCRFPFAVPRNELQCVTSKQNGSCFSKHGQSWLRLSGPIHLPTMVSRIGQEKKLFTVYRYPCIYVHMSCAELNISSPDVPAGLCDLCTYAVRAIGSGNVNGWKRAGTIWEGFKNRW